MATIGQALTAPESGWKRYDDTHPAFIYDTNSAWTTVTNSSYFNSTRHYKDFGTTNSFVKFKFNGTKLRLIGLINTFGYSSSVAISIDGIIEYFNQVGSSIIIQALIYEKIGLSSEQEHEVIIDGLVSAAGSFLLDAIDIDSTGRLLHPDEVTDPKDLEIGKRISCHYTATSNAVGTFSNLGGETYKDGKNDFIPPASSATPNGDFYVLYVGDDFLGRKILVADRNVQHSISWDTLNSEGIASGSGKKIPLIYSEDIIPTMTSNSTPNGVATATGGNDWMSGFEPYKAFDKDGNTYWSSKNTSGILYYYFPDGSKKKVVRYAVQCRATDSTTAPKNWTLEVSDDGTSYQIIDTQTNIVFTNGERKYFYIKNPIIGYKYRLNITANNGNTSYVAVAELSLYEEKADFGFTTRLLTGGTSSTDKDNEWDKYIVSSNLNGMITPGYNAVWSWSGIASWTSTTGSASANRVIRGNASVSTYTNTTTSNTANTTIGFRPVILVESLFTLITKYLFEDNGEIKKYLLDSWQSLGLSPATEELFLSDGMNDIAAVYGTKTKELISDSPKLLVWYNDQAQPDKNFKMTYVTEPKLVKANGDIDLSKADNIDSFTLTASESGTGILRVVYSIDEGLTWRSYHNNILSDINIDDLVDVKTNGMTINEFNTANWNDLLSSMTTKKIRFAYYLELQSSADIAETDSLVVQIDMKGKWRKAKKGTDFSYYYPSNTSLKVEFFNNGDFKINY